MLVYNVLFFVVICGMLSQFLHFQKLSKYAFCVASIMVLLIVGLRHETLGTDTINYLYFFLHPFSKSGYYYAEEVEPVYLLVNLIVGLVSDNKYVFLFIVSFMSLVPVLYLIWKNSNNKNFSLFLFLSFSVGMSLFFLSFSMMRQFLAIGFFAIMVNLYVANDYKLNWKVILAGLLMVFSHYSSIMVIIVFLIHRIQFSKTILASLILFSAIVGYYIGNYLSLLLMFAESLDKGFYFTNLSDSQYDIISKVPYLGIYLLLLYKCSKEYCNNFWMKGLFMAIFLSNFLSFGNNADRMCSYFYMLSLIAIPNAISEIKEKTITSVLLGGIILYFSYKYYLTFDIMQDTLYVLSPYKSCI